MNSSSDLDPIIRRARRRPLWSPLASTREVHFDRSAIERIVPHRDEALLLDTITAVDLEHGFGRALRTLRPDDPGFRGHFPREPIYPGTRLVELIGQAGGCMLYFYGRQTLELPTGIHPHQIRVLKIHHAVFLDAVRPGDELTVLTQMLVCDEMTAIFVGQAINQSGVICTVTAVEVYLVDL